MYIAWTCIYLGVALVVNTCWLAILAPLLLALTHRTILAEERRLEKDLGEGYRAYKRKVGRYL
jgi:protein-S-isoprenylcysteine O-methyltransferase Ste14